MLDLPIKKIHNGNRHRKDMGDLKELAQSIKEEGLLQPIGVTEEMELVFGERRLRACVEVLKWKTIPARIVSVSSIVAGEYAENEMRKDFTVSERIAIAAALEKQLPNRNGVPKARQKIDRLRGERTDDYVAEKAGFGNHETYRQAAKVVENGTPTLIQAMDEGRVSIYAAAILVDADPDEQEAVLELDEKAILRAAKEIRERNLNKRIEEQQAKERRAKPSIKPTWTITADQQVVKCDLLLVDPPYGITDEPWEPENLEEYTHDWCKRWAKCGADFLAIFWSQEHLFEGRQWFDKSLEGYKCQQVLIWQYRNTVKIKNRYTFRPSWEPIFLYRRNDCRRLIKPSGTDWGDDFHDFDCHVAALPRNMDNGHAMKQHPCQKPVGVMTWLISAMTEPAEKVVSIFCGVAPCGIAAVQLGRKYHGVEINAKYRRIGESRLATYGTEKTS